MAHFKTLSLNLTRKTAKNYDKSQDMLVKTETMYLLNIKDC